MKRSAVVVAVLNVIVITLFLAAPGVLSKTDSECSTLVVEKCLPASGCDWCPLKEKCVSLDTFPTSCPACELLSQSTCVQSSGNCEWCPSLARCVSTSSHFNLRTCWNCSSLDRDGCKAMAGCSWCQRSYTCVDTATYTTSACSCTALADISTCEADIHCGWCDRVTFPGCMAAMTAAEFAGACPSCNSMNGCPNTTTCQQACNSPGSQACITHTTPASCQAAAGCRWDGLFSTCYNQTEVPSTCATAGNACTSIVGCRDCPALGTCVSELNAGACSCSIRRNETECIAGVNCKWCGNWTCIDNAMPCQQPETFTEQRCAAVPLYEWCETLQACLSLNRTSSLQTAFCSCSDVIAPNVCWWWQGCDVCTNGGGSSLCMPTDTCPSGSSSGLSSSGNNGGMDPMLKWGLIGGGAGILVIVIIAAICAAVCCRSGAKHSAASEMAMTATSTGAAQSGTALRRFDPSRSRELRPDDSELQLLPDKSQLDFGASTSPLDVDKPATDKIILRHNNGKKTKWYFAMPPDDSGCAGERYELLVEPSEGVLKSDEEMEIVLTLTPLCTTVLDINLPLVVEGVGHTFIHARARTALTIKLDYSELQVANLIGDGAYGRVYRGTWRSTEVAIKEYRAGMLDSERAKQDVLREIDLLSRLRSPHVVTFYGVVLTKTRACIVMEFCPMGSLASLLKKQKIALPLKLRYALGCARGMQFLHANHVLHRDLKTDNLLVISTDPMSPVHVKLTDFGASRLVSDEGAATYTKGVGTCNYMAPEILSNQPYSSKADVYSFALVMWGILSQKQPFEDFNSQYAIIKFVVEGERLVPPPGVPVPVNKLMIACWAQDPDARPVFDECVQVLEQACNTCVGTLRT